MTHLRGTYPIVPTPFTDDGSLDVESIHSLTRFMVDRGVQGLAILGVMGEAQKLTEAEKVEAIRAFREALPRHLHLIVGTGAAATDPAVHMAKQAAELGADALLVGPPSVQNDDVIFTYYQRIGQAVDLPIVLHDYPASTGILMSVPLIARLEREIPTVRYIKLEDPPTGLKMERVRQATEGRLGIFGALGGQYAFEELDRGALGIMTGFAYPELLVELQRLYDAGDRQGAARLFYRMLPLIRFEFQPGLGVALRKEILVRRGAIRSAAVRHPGAVPDARTLEHLDMILAYLREEGLDV
ncbi:MAG: dihydrodipicolinate synthase family protein [Thermaerobacter sp.]|nr:MAG: dihydrodipicolinate synthase family protein [Bacillota bacterium]